VSTMTIDELRLRIDLIDEQLVTLLNMRATCAIEIGRLKRQVSMPIYQPEREAEVGRHVRAVTSQLGGPLSAEAVGRLFERIVDEARQIEALAGSGAALPEGGAAEAGRTTDGVAGWGGQTSTGSGHGR
jgi:chorismate mutase